MPGIIFTSRYLRNAGVGQVKNLLNYMATRPNAEKLPDPQSGEVTKRQKDWIEKEIKKQHGIKSLFEYEDYVKNPTKANASELIEKIAEQQLETAEGIENYVGYLAKRPRAERGEQGHALWNGSDEPVSLRRVTQEAARHRGRIWTHVVSLRREDAERLGYDNAEAWRELVRGKSTEMAKEMGIPLEDFVWYGAFHNEGHHPHIHVFCYSKKPKQGYLSNRGIKNLRRSFASEIFHDDLLYVYERKDEVRKEIKDLKMRKMEDGKEDAIYDFSLLINKLALLNENDQEETIKVENTNSRAEAFNQLEAEFGRPLSSMELQIVNDWLDKDNYSAIMIKLALRQAVMNSALNLQYMDRILQSWDRQGLRTERDINEHEKRFEQRKEAGQKPEKKTLKKPKIPIYKLGE